MRARFCVEPLRRTQSLFVEPLEARCLLSYVLTELGTLGGDTSFGYGINDSAQVVGTSWTKMMTSSHAFLWDSDTGMRDLGTLGNNWSVAYAINDKGMAVGSAGSEALVWDSTGAMTDIGPGIAYSLNNAGQVVGGSQGRAFIWDPKSGMSDIGRGTAHGVNNAGQVVGESAGHAFLWDNISGMTDLGTLGGGLSAATGINDKGQVVGWSSVPTAPRHAFIWQNETGMIDLDVGSYCGRFSGDDAPAMAINSWGQVVGFAFDTLEGQEPCGFVWDAAKGGRQLLSGRDFYINEALAINDAGQITGFGSRDGFHIHAFLLTPDEAAARQQAAFALSQPVPQQAAPGGQLNQRPIDAATQPSPDATPSPATWYSLITANGMIPAPSADFYLVPSPSVSPCETDTYGRCWTIMELFVSDF